MKMHPLPVLASVCLCMTGMLFAAPASPILLQLSKTDSTTSVFRPLEKASVHYQNTPAKSRLIIKDAFGRIYLDSLLPAKPGAIAFEAIGALGAHQISLLDSSHNELTTQQFSVDVTTSVTTTSGWYDEELRRMQMQIGTGRRSFIEGKEVNMHVSWVRDNYYSYKASKYWAPEMKGFPNLFIKYQRPNGMIMDFMGWRGANVDPFSKRLIFANSREALWGKEWLSWAADTVGTFDRMPVEADVEFLLVLQVYESWQASGDDRWMASTLPALEKAMKYEMTDPLRWSKKYQLVKRAFSIDTWDYQHEGAKDIHPKGGKNKLGAFESTYIDSLTPMGIMHGDQSGMYQASARIAKMYNYLGNSKRGAYWDSVATAFKTNADKVCWNGTFYTHFVHIDSFPTDLGPREAEVLSFSNPHNINRGMASHEQAVSIIKEYQRRREVNKDKSFAEWYTIDPSFAQGFGAQGEYMNGGITPIVAGELAKAAFDHGFETYGADILKRVSLLRKKYNTINAVYRPLPLSAKWEKETFTLLDLSKSFNRNLIGDAGPGCIGEKTNDMRNLPRGTNLFMGKQFKVVEPAVNNNRSLMVLASDTIKGSALITVPVARATAKSIYFMQVSASTVDGRSVGTYRVNYEDGTGIDIPITAGKNIGHWWGGTDLPAWKVVWRGRNPVTSLLVMGIYGWDNPSPAKPITSITLKAGDNGCILIPAITLSSAPVQLDEGAISTGIPDVWAAAAVAWGGLEGLVGITDNLKTMNDVTVAPRWQALKETSARADIRYGGSTGYVSYDYKHDTKANRVLLRWSGSGATFRFHVLLPAGSIAKSVTINGVHHPFENVKVEQSPYADFTVNTKFGGSVVIVL